MFKISALVFLLVISGLLASVLSYQRMPEGVPAELVHLYNRGLEDWNPPAEFCEKFPYYLSGFDEDHKPVWIWQFGKWDVHSALQQGRETRDTLDKYVDQAVLTVYNSSFTKDGIIPVTAILDMEGFSLKQLRSPKAVEFGINKLRSIFACLNSLHSAYIVNTNFIAQNLLNLVKPLLGGHFEKLQVYGTNRATWMPKVLKNIPRDQLPSWYGGTENFQPVKVYG